MKRSRKRIISAIFLLITIALIIVIIVIIKDKNLLSRYDDYYLVIDNAEGLGEKDYVLIKGMKVGHVKEISFVQDGSARICVHLVLKKSVKITEGSSATIRDDDNIKSRYVEIMPANSREILLSGDTIPYHEHSALIDDNSAEPLKKKTEEMLQSFDTLVQISEMLSEYDSEIKKSSGYNTENNVVFRIQILTSAKDLQLTDPRFKGLTDVWKYYHNGIYKYTAGYTANYNTALILKDQMRENGYPGAFVVAFEDGERISLEKN